MAKKKKQAKIKSATKSVTARKSKAAIAPSRIASVPDRPAVPGNDKYVVHGVVRGSDRVPKAGDRVLAYDSKLGTEELLGNAKILDGNYRIAYSRKEFSRAGKDGTYLRVCVVDADDVELVSSEVRRNAPADSVIDLTLPQRYSEFDLLVQALLPLLTGQGPHSRDLRIEELENTAIEFLARETGASEERIGFLVAATKLSLDTGTYSEVGIQTFARDPGSPRIPATAFYGWFRVGLNAERLGERSVDSWIDALNTAVAQNIIPDFGKSLEQIGAAMKAHQVERLLKPAKGTEPSSLGDLLGTMARRLSPEKERMVATAIRDLPALGDEFVKRLKEAKFDEREIADVQVTRALGDLTQNHAALVHDLQSLRPAGADASLRYLAAPTPAYWRELVKKHGVPSSLPVSPQEYADQLERAVEAKHPTAVFAARVKDDILQLKDSRFKAAADFLVANPDLELTRHNARAYVGNDADLDGVEDQEELINTLQRIQCAQKLSFKWPETGVLLNKKLYSSPNILQQGRERFVKAVEKDIPLERAASLYDAAQYAHDTTIALIGKVAASVRESTFDVFVPATKQTDHPALKDYPNLRKLFGNLGACECAHCQSVLSPAAYFVDVLRFLEPQALDGRVVPLLVLLARRPDLADLELTCANTNTEVPYIDLVLEILENAVALPMEIPAPYGFDPDVDFKKTPLEGNVVAALRSVLSHTAISVGEQLTVKEDDGASLYPYSYPWAVTDGTRTWGLQGWPDQFQGLPLSGRSQLNVPDFAQAVTLLDQGTLPAPEWLIPADAGEQERNLPIKEAPAITKIEPGRKWEVQYKRSVRVEISLSGRTGEVILKTPQGGQFGVIPATSDVLQDLEAVLGSGELAEPLISKLPQFLTYQYSITPVGSEWEIEVTGSATLTYYPKRLEISSLTHQSSGSHGDLKPSPENRNPQAYIALDAAVYPWTLPFSLGLEEVRAFLERRGIPRLQLMEQSHPASRLLDDAPADAIAREVLGLSKSEVDIITGTAPQQSWEFWDLQKQNNSVTDLNDESTVTGSWIQVLMHVSVLLQRSGLSYRELLNVLQTRFVQNVAPTLAPLGNDCNISRMALIGLTANHLNRIHRFVRLWRKLGWSVSALDLAISAVTNDVMDLTPATLRGLSHLQRLHSLLGLPVAAIARWQGTLITARSTDHTSEKRPEIKSVYELLFENPAIQNPPDPDFALSQLSAGGKTLGDKASAIAGVLGIRVSDLTLLTKAVVSGNSPALSLANLTALHRNAALAKALGLSVRDYIRALNLIDADPFQSFKGLIEFVEAVQYVRGNRFSITLEEIDYLLRYTSDSEPTSLITAGWSEQTLQDIRVSLQTVQREVLRSAEPPAEHLRKTLTRLGWYPTLIEEAVDLLAFGTQFEVEIPKSTPSAVVTIPQPLEKWVSYLAGDGKLIVFATLSQAEWAALLAANAGDAAVTGAIGKLQTEASAFSAKLPQHQHHLQSLELPTHRLAYIAQPDIPAEMSARCYYDSPAKEVVFVGWMTEIDQKKLKDALPPNTLQGLLDLSDAYEVQPGENSLLSVNELETLFAGGQTPESRVAFMLEKLLPWFTRETVVERLSAAVGLQQALVRGLLSSHLDQARTLATFVDPSFADSDARVAMTATSFPDQFRALGKLHKAALICSKLGLKPSELSWLPASQSQANPPRAFATLALDGLPARPNDPAAEYSSFQSLLQLFELRDRPQIGAGLLAKVLEHANNRETPVHPEREALQADIAQALHISTREVINVAGTQLALRWRDDYLAPARLSALLELLLTIQKLGGKADEVASLTKDTPGQEEATLARHMLRALFDAKSWPEQLKPIEDGLRDRQRAALVARLKARDHLRDASDLYDRYLIDVEMGPCKASTRVLHAISAAQLFVQRCLMNLEEDVAPDLIDVKRWQWMKNYRVWEANRKVFLYPENWIEPELRDDKSELFKELEGQLLQNELDSERAEEILKGYLKQLEDISRLAIVGMYVEKRSGPDDKPTGTTVHIVGRTHNRPSHFFYRRWVLSPTVNYWTAWERVPLDGVKTDHVVPFVLRGDTYIAWPEITQVPAQLDSGDGPAGAKWRLQMAWTRHTARGWGERYLSEDTIEHPWVYGTPENQSFTFRVNDDLHRQHSVPLRVVNVAVASLPDGRLQLWATTTSGGLLTTSIVQTDPRDAWSIWSDFLAKVGPLPARATSLAVAPLPDHRLQLWATTVDGGLLTTWMTTSEPNDPNALWSDWSDFLADTYPPESLNPFDPHPLLSPGKVISVAVASLPDGRLQLWATTDGGGLLTASQNPTDPNAAWLGWSDFLADMYARGTPNPFDPLLFPGKVTGVAVASLPDGRLQLWATTDGGGLQTTSQTTTDPNAAWSGWSDFLADMYPSPPNPFRPPNPFSPFLFPGKVTGVAVAPLPDGRLQLWATTDGGGLLTTSQTPTNQYAAWSGWQPFLLGTGGLPGSATSVAVAPLPGHRLQLWATTTDGGLQTANTFDERNEPIWFGPSDFLREVGATLIIPDKDAESGSVSIECYGARRDGNLSYRPPSPPLDPPPSREVVFNNSNYQNKIAGEYVTITFSGCVVAETTEAGTGNSVYRAIGGAEVKAQLLIADANAQNWFNAIYWGRVSSIKYGPNNQAYDDKRVTQAVGVSSPVDGKFTLTLRIFGEALLPDAAFKPSPTFSLEVTLPGGAQTVPPQTFPLHQPQEPRKYLTYEFHKNFTVTGGVAPLVPAVTMGLISRFTLLSSEDAEIVPRSGEAPLQGNSLSLPDKTIAYASGYLTKPADQNAPATPSGALMLPDNHGANSVVVWQGNVTPRHFVLPAFPVNSEPPEVLYYSDSVNSYFIRREVTSVDPEPLGTPGKYQILLNGHPRARDLRRAVARGGVGALFDLKEQEWQDPIDFDGNTPNNSVVDTGIGQSLTRRAIRFEPDEAQSPYASYNTELFFHAPFLIANYLSNNQRFEEAQRWFHFVFDPATNDPIKGAKRYWRYLPFREHSETKPIDELLDQLADPHSSGPEAEASNKAVTTQIEAWLDHPFRPHAVARLRPRAYQFAVVFKYLDNLIAWADRLFRQSTTESINEATQLYILVTKLLGARPQNIPRNVRAPALTYRKAAGKWDMFSNAWCEVEANLSSPSQGALNKTMVSRDDSGSQSLTTIGMSYFCVPDNEKLQAYWDTVENRLFNIRHCRNIEGVETQVPLFQPPIDPGLLVRAVAAGLDISTVLSDMNVPLPYYRFSTLAQKASELCGELKALSGALLSALEKKDAEQLALLRSNQEIELLSLVKDVKQQQIEEAKINLEALHQSEELAIVRFLQYQKLLGKRNAAVPDDPYADVEQTSAIQVSGSADSGELSALGIIQAEQDQFDFLDIAHTNSLVSGATSMVAGILHAIPQSGTSLPILSDFGGIHLGSVLDAVASYVNLLASDASHAAGRVGTVGQYQRRQDEWVFQSRLALKEIGQVRKQILASEIRRDIAGKELSNHEKQIKNAQATDRFMRDKYTNQELYQWMARQVSDLYFRTYQLAFDVAKRAERSFRHELGLQDSSFVKAGYWDSLKKGLMSGDQLYHDIKRMEVAYLDQNRREYEITKHLSLLQIDPRALITLRQTGKCELTVPESIFDLDFAGHYLRRIKTVSLTIPCVAGPYTGVPCTLTLLKSQIRKSNSSSRDYARDMENDDSRFIDLFGAIQSIVTSTGQNDGGLFEPNLRDERYLPFEGAGAVSTWRIELPSEFPAFDYDTISDVVLHVRYTARNGGDSLKQKASGELLSAINPLEAAGREGLARMFSLRQEFPTEWHQLIGGTNQGPQSQLFAITKNRFPFLFTGKHIKISSVDMYALPKSDAKNAVFPAMTVTPPTPPANIATLENGGSDIGGLLGKALTLDVEVPVDAEEGNARWKLEIPKADVAKFQKDIDDILMVCHYKLV